MSWKQTKQKLLAACGAAASAPPQLSIPTTWHLFHLVATAIASRLETQKIPSVLTSWKCLTPASWNQHCRAGRAARWPQLSEWQVSGSCTSLVPWDGFLLQDLGGIDETSSLLQDVHSLLEKKSVILVGQGWDPGGCAAVLHSWLC